MHFIANREFKRMLELISKSAELRQLIYVIATMMWTVAIIKALH